MRSFLKVFSFLSFFVILQGCHKDGRIMTVNGYCSAGNLGMTLPHEHFLVDFTGADSTNSDRWNKDSVISVVLPYLIEAKESGIQTIFECTPAYLGRDPELLLRLAKLSGIHIVTNTGYYGAINNKALPKIAFSQSAKEIAEIWIGEWEKGIDATGVRPGFIKIAVPGDSVLSPMHEKLLQAAAITHLRTGLTINAHTGPFKTAMAELAVLKREGVDPSAFIWTHAQADNFDTHIKVAQMGAWISLDNVMEDNIHYYVQALVNLKKNGLLNKALISHDAGWYDVVNPASVQYRGYTAIVKYLKPALKKEGFTEDDWFQLTRINPARAYMLRVRKI